MGNYKVRNKVVILDDVTLGGDAASIDSTFSTKNWSDYSIIIVKFGGDCDAANIGGIEINGITSGYIHGGKRINPTSTETLIGESGAVNHMLWDATLQGAANQHIGGKAEITNHPTDGNLTIESYTGNHNTGRVAFMIGINTTAALTTLTGIKIKARTGNLQTGFNMIIIGVKR